MGSGRYYQNREIRKVFEECRRFNGYSQTDWIWTVFEYGLDLDSVLRGMGFKTDIVVD